MNPTILSRQAFRKKVLDCCDKYLAMSEWNKLSVGIYCRGKTYVFGNDKEFLHFKYDMGSISKTLCAHLILSLCEQGLVEPDKTVDAYIPLKKGRYPTIYELLTHTAGYRHLTPMEITVPRLLFHPYAKYNVYQHCHGKRVVKCLERRNGHKPRKANGFSYSDFPYAVLALVAQAVTKTQFAPLFEGFIQNQVGMKETVVGSHATRNIPSVLSGKRIPHWVWHEDNPYLASGGVVTTIGDMLKYIAFEIESNEPFVTKAHALCERSVSGRRKEAMCIGWHTYKDSDQLWHVGGVGTFRSSVVINRKRGLGVVVLGNSKGLASANVHYLAKMLYSELKIKKIVLT